MIPHVRLGDGPTRSVWVMSALLALFVARVAGQVVVALAHPPWLPAMARWYSGVLPYRFLLPSQLLIVALMVAMILGVATRTGALGTRRKRVGVVVLVASYVYATGMIGRALYQAAQPPERRGVVIPIVFHFVLAAFLFVYGSWHVRATAARLPG